MMKEAAEKLGLFRPELRVSGAKERRTTYDSWQEVPGIPIFRRVRPASEELVVFQAVDARGNKADRKKGWDVYPNFETFQEFHPETGGVGKPVQLFSFPKATQASPTFSPDGSRVAFVSDKDGSPR